MTIKTGIRVEMRSPDNTLLASLLRDDATFAAPPRAGERIPPAELGLTLDCDLMVIDHIEHFPHLPGVRTDHTGVDAEPETLAVLRAVISGDRLELVLRAAAATGWRVLSIGQDGLLTQPHG